MGAGERATAGVAEPSRRGPEVLLGPAAGNQETVAAAASIPAGFQVESVFTGLDRPTAFAFSPDGRVFVAEQSGILRVFDSLSDDAPTVFADLRTRVHAFWDRGLLGMTLHPGFPSQPYVYVFYSHDAPIGGTAPRWGAPGATSDGCPTPPGATTDGCVIGSRLSRLTASGDVMSGSELVLIEDWCQQYPSHSAGTVAFGPDGALYASHGDGAAFHTQDWGQLGGSPGSPVPRNPCGDPPSGEGGAQAPPTAQGGSLRSQDLRTPGDPTSLDGTIIRVDASTGAPFAGNPLAGPDQNARRIIANGLRNPYRFTFRPGTSELWIAEVGDTRVDEIDRITDRESLTNFGWPCYEGTARHPHWDFNDLSMCEELYAAPGAATSPAIEYPHAGTHTFPGDTCPTDGGSPTGIAFYGTGDYPALYDGALFIGDYTRKCIWVVPLGANGSPDATLGRTFLGDAGGPVDLKIGPGGDLFYSDYDNGALQRVRYFGGNQPPVASATADPTSGDAPLLVAFDGTGSDDADDDPLTFAWDLDGDGAFDDGSSPTASHRYEAVGSYDAALRVSDPSGASDTATVTITVGDAPPTPTIAQPAATLRWRVGQRVDFSGSATDQRDGTLPASALQWTLVMHHCATVDSCHTHDIQSYAGVAGGSFVAPDHEYPSHLELRLRATDSAGLSSTTSVRLDPRTIDLRVRTEPAGLTVSAGARVGATPFDQVVIEGSRISVTAPLSQVFGGRVHEFVSWSDGGAASHATTLTASTTLTATYREVAASAFAADAFGRTISGGWGTADLGGAYELTGGAAAFAVNGAMGTMRIGAGQSRGAFLPATARDVDMTFTLATDGTPTGAGQYAYAVARRVSGNSEYRVKVRLRPNGTVMVQGTRVSGGVETGLGSETRVAGLTYGSGVTLRVRARIDGASPTTIRARVWALGQPEPSTWAYQATDATAALQGPGRLGIRAYLSSSSTGAPVTFAFDDLVAGPTALATDAFARTITDGWGAPEVGGQYVLSGAASAFDVSGGRGIMTLLPGRTRATHLPSVAPRDADIRFSIGTDRSASGSGQYAYALARRVDAATEYRAGIRFAGTGAIVAQAGAVTGRVERPFGRATAIPGLTHTPGARYRVRVEVTGASPTTVRIKLWRDGTAEPSGWAFQGTDSTSGLQAAGSVGLRSYLSSSTTGGAVAFSFDDLLVVAQR